MGALKYNSFYLSHVYVLPLKTPNRNNIIFLHSFDSTIRVDDVLDLTREYHNLLQRNEDGVTNSYTYDFGLLSADGNPYMLDDLGSPVRFGDEAYGFDEFGSNLHEHTSSQPFGFTGYSHDPIAGNYFAQQRQYDPTTGRFVSEDRFRGFVHAPNTLNTYAYCWSNPIKMVDLDGLYPTVAPDFNREHGRHDPIQWTWDGTTIVIDVFVTIQGDTGAMIDGHSVHDLTIQGIEAWRGVHPNVFGQDITIQVNVHEGRDNWWDWVPFINNQRHIPVNITDGAGRANLTIPGGTNNWSTARPGTVNMYTYFSNGDPRLYWQFRQIMTHEFGHVFGIGDGYEDLSRGRLAADMLGRNELMGYGGRSANMYISHFTIQMLLLALMTDEWQRYMDDNFGYQSLGAQPWDGVFRFFNDCPQD